MIHERVQKNMVFTEILAKIDRAAVNGQKLHLDVEHVRALAMSPVYATIADMKAQEFAELWHDQNHPNNRPESNSANSGSNPESSAANGSLPGTMLPLVHAAAEKQVSHTLEKVSRLSKLKKRSQTSLPSGPSPASRSRPRT